MTTAAYQHWRKETDSDNIIWLVFDKKDTDTNTLDLPVLDELSQLLAEASNTPYVKGVVVTSGKKRGFIAGANIEKLKEIEDRDQIHTFLQRGQDVFSQLEAMTIPTVALINGFCLGGGLELALACRYRIALEDDTVQIGLPEVKLGFHPGWGGTVRLPKLIGPLAAMDLMLTGRGLRPKAAKKIGLVDDIVPERQMAAASRYFILNKPAVKKASIWQRMLNFAPLRSLIAKMLRRQVRGKARIEHYPAPYAMIDNWQAWGVYNLRAMQEEIPSILQLVQQSNTVKNLIRVFTLQERLKAFGKRSQYKAKHIHVIGAGVMGGDIAAWCAFKGMTVTLHDQNPEAIAAALGRAKKLFSKKFKNPRLEQLATDRLIPDFKGLGISRADVIIEAIVEKLSVKQALFQEIEKQARKNAILATNTSSIPLDEINTVMENPQRLVGIHFFNPVALMPLVEVVYGQQTDEDILDDVFSFARQLDRLPLPVKSSPGFLVNRVLMPYLMECMILLKEGNAAKTIDEAALEFGMPMGPVELADTVGLDVCLSVAQNLTQVYGGSIPPELFEMVQAGKLGKKSGRGFYEYRNDKAIKPKPSQTGPLDKAAITDRLIMRIVKESSAALNDKVVSDADLVDAGMIFGAGFAPFTGGPLCYAKQIGQEILVTKKTDLTQRFGERFDFDVEVIG